MRGPASKRSVLMSRISVELRKCWPSYPPMTSKRNWSNMTAPHSLRWVDIRGPDTNDMRRVSRKSKTSVLPKQLVPSLPPTTMRRCLSTQIAVQAPRRMVSGGPLTQDIAEERKSIGLKLTKLVEVINVRTLPVSSSTAPGCCRLRFTTRSSSASARLRFNSPTCWTRNKGGCFFRCCAAKARERRRSSARSANASRCSSSFLGTGSMTSISGSSLSGGHAMGG
mmetsp:Transcript_81920/g.237565  ORF Transcript_81920/g.237565 Transcript_81920/m.237565 type:complete len:224 (+) Transcript_81920:761-1432(+)